MHSTFVQPLTVLLNAAHTCSSPLNPTDTTVIEALKANWYKIMLRVGLSLVFLVMQRLYRRVSATDLIAAGKFPRPDPTVRTRAEDHCQSF
jgi:hypothetical protein